MEKNALFKNKRNAENANKRIYLKTEYNKRSHLLSELG